MPMLEMSQTRVRSVLELGKPLDRQPPSPVGGKMHHVVLSSGPSIPCPDIPLVECVIFDSLWCLLRLVFLRALPLA